MPFGNSVSSHDLEFKWRRDGLRLQQAWPRFGGLTQGAQTTSGAALLGEAAADEGVPAPDDALLQRVGRQVVERAEEQPHAAHDGQDLAKGYPQHGYVAG